MCATRLQRTPCAPGLAASHPKLFSTPRLFTHPSHPWRGITGAKSCATLMAINAVPALVRTCQHIRPFATRTVRDSPPLHCQKRRERVSACTVTLRHVCTALSGCWKRVQLHVLCARATCSNLNLYTKSIVSGETNSCVFVKTRRHDIIKLLG